MKKWHDRLFYLIVHLETSCHISTFSMAYFLLLGENYSFYFQFSQREENKVKLRVFRVEGICSVSQTVMDENQD